MSKKNILKNITQNSQNPCQFTKIKSNTPKVSIRAVTFKPLLKKLRKKHSLPYQEINIPNSRKGDNLSIRSPRNSFQNSPLVQLLKDHVEKDQGVTNGKKQQYVGSEFKKKLIQRMKTFDDSKELEDIGSIKQSLIQVKKIHSILEELKVFGFSDKKVTQWMLKFLTKKTKLMKKVFISQYINKKSVNDAYSFEHQPTYEGMKNRLIKFYKKAKISKDYQLMKEIEFLYPDLKEFRIYFEEILLIKNTNKLEEIKQSIKHRYKNINPEQWKANNLVLEPPHALTSQVTHFLTDLNRLEARYGQFQLITKMNKKKFHQISEAEEFVKNHYKQIMIQM